MTHAQDSRRPAWPAASWWLLLATLAVVPVAVGAVLFVGRSPLSASFYFVPKIAVASVLLGASAALWLVAVRTGTAPVRTVPGWRWLLAFLALAALSVALSDNPLLAFFGRTQALMGLYSFLLCGGAYVMVTQLVTGQARMRQAAWAVVAGGVAVAAIALMQVAGYDPIPQASVVPWMVERGYSTLGNPDHTGTYLVTPFLLALGLSLTERDARRTLIAAAAATISGIALLETLTRGAWVAAAIGAVVLLVVLGSRVLRSGAARWTLFAGLGLAGAAIVVRFSGISSRVAELFSGTDAGSGRLILWKNALQVASRSPLLGTGPDSFGIGWQRLGSTEVWAVTHTPIMVEDPHNVLLLAAATVGIPAAIALVVFAAAALRSAACVLKGASARSSVYLAWVVAGACQLVAMAFAMATLPVVLVSAVSLAVVVSPRATAIEARAGWRRAVSAATAVVAVAFVGVGAAWGYADFVHGRTLTDPGPGVVTTLEAASRVAPWDRAIRERIANVRIRLASEALASGSTGSAGLYADALASSERLIAFDPAFSTSWEPEARLLANAGRYLGEAVTRSAIASANRGLGHFRYDTALVSQKAYALLDLRLGREAEEALTPFWRLDGSDPLLGLLYVKSLRLQGKTEDALSALARLSAEFPNSAEVAAARSGR